MQRVSYHLLKDGRIPIFENLTLNVSIYGNDHSERLSLQSPFRTPQAAIDWAVANCDFRNVDSLILNIESSTFDRLEIRNTINGLRKIVLIGSNPGGSFPTINSVYIQSHNLVEISNITFNATGSRNALEVYNSVVEIHGDIFIVGSTTEFGIYVNNGRLHRVSGNVTFNGTFQSMICLLFNGVASLDNCHVTVNGTATNNTFRSHGCSVLHFYEATFSGSVTGMKYAVEECSVLYTNGKLSNIPGHITGATDGSSFSN